MTLLERNRMQPSQCVTIVGCGSSSPFDNLLRAGAAALDDCKYEDAAKFLNGARIIARELRIYDLTVANIYIRLAVVYIEQGKHEKAGMALLDLATVYEKQGLVPDAEQILSYALSIFETCWTPTDLRLADVLERIVRNLNEQGKHQEIEQHQKRLVHIKELNLPYGNANMLASLEQLANYYFLQKVYGESERLFKRVLAIREREGINQRETSEIMVSLALVLHRNKSFKQAESLLKQALALQEKVLPKREDELLRSTDELPSAVYALACLYTCNSRYVQSEPYWRRLLTLNERLQGIHSTRLCESVHCLALATFKTSRYEESKRLWTRLQTIWERSGNPNLRDLSFAAHYLAEIARLENRNEEAEELFEKAIQLKKQVFGSNHKEVAMTLEAYSRLLGSTFRDAAAEHMRACARAIMRPLYTVPEPDTITLKLVPVAS